MKVDASTKLSQQHYEFSWKVTVEGESFSFVSRKNLDAFIKDLDVGTPYTLETTSVFTQKRVRA